MFTGGYGLLYWHVSKIGDPQIGLGFLLVSLETNGKGYRVPSQR